MALSLQQVLKQTQKLIMTPQMQQSIQLLQLNSMELEQIIHEEMMENPFLELSDDEEALETRTEDGNGAEEGEQAEEREPDSGISEENREEAEKTEQAAEALDEPSERDEELRKKEQLEAEDGGEREEKTSETDDFDNFQENDVNWDDEYVESDLTSYSSTREDTEEHDFTTYTAISTSLYDSLMRQVRLSVLEGKELEIGEFIVGNLDENGFLDSSLENQAMILGYPPDLIQIKPGPNTDEALRRVLRRVNPEADETHIKQLNRKQLTAMVVGALIARSPEEVMSMSRKEWLVGLIAKRLGLSPEEALATPPPDLVLECIAKRLKTDTQTVFDVLEVIQEFEPTGVGARDLGECLRLQCEEQGIRNRVLYQILDGHLQDLQQKRFREISKALECSEDDVVEVFHLVSRLDPRPGQSQTKDSVRYITPDVYVKKVDDKYMYFLNEGDAGKLRIASNYRRMIRQRARRAAAAKKNGTDAEDTQNASSDNNAQYAHEKYKNAVWLIKNIEKRKSTVLRVTEAIMNYQKDFLEKGIEHLRPLTLRNIAEVVGMHESTIARVTTQKYVETPRGIFELKFFFSSGLETDTGEDASSRSIKEMITQMIQAEDTRKPLSDQKIADMLKDRGIQIARRTVAKYREQLKILPAKLRKEVS